MKSNNAIRLTLLAILIGVALFFGCKVQREFWTLKSENEELIRKNEKLEGDIDRKRIQLNLSRGREVKWIKKYQSVSEVRDSLAIEMSKVRSRRHEAIDNINNLSPDDLVEFFTDELSD